MSGSKYETMAKAVEKKIEELNKGAQDRVRQKQLEQKLKRIDAETDRKIKERKASPIKPEQIKKDAELELKNRLVEIKRKAQDDLEQVKLQQEQLEIQYNLKKSELEKNLKKIEEKNKIYVEREESEAQKIYGRRMASVNNGEEVLNIDIERIKEEAEQRKAEIEIELGNVIAVNESKTSKLEALDKLYEDIKEISLHLGDVKK